MELGYTFMMESDTDLEKSSEVVTNFIKLRTDWIDENLTNPTTFTHDVVNDEEPDEDGHTWLEHRVKFIFHNDEDAVLFQLTWGGDEDLPWFVN